MHGPVLQPFVLGDNPYAGGQHRGIDIGASAGTAVLAPVGGSVSFAGTVPGGGRTVSIQSQDGYTVTLLHLGSEAVHRGDSIAEGTAVGTVGPSGAAEVEVPYVHLGVRRSDDQNGYLDPLLFLPQRDVAPAPVDSSPQIPPPAAPAPPAAPPAPGSVEPTPRGADDTTPSPRETETPTLPSAASESPALAAVSYTHLTLPTNREV